MILLCAIACSESMSGVGALRENGLSGTYAFTLQATVTDPTKLCNGRPACGGVNNVNGSLSAFFKQFAKDLSAKKCPGVSSQLIAVAGSVAAAAAKAGDVFYGAGTLIADGAGNFTDGQVTLNGTSVNSEFVNFQNGGVLADVCGGSDKSGECATLCTAASLICSTAGGYGITGSGGLATLYVHPELAAGQCGPQQITADLCCNDPSLVARAVEMAGFAARPSRRDGLGCSGPKMPVLAALPAMIPEVQPAIAKSASAVAYRSFMLAL